MKQLLLLADPEATKAQLDELVVHWEKRDVPPGEYSLPVLLDSEVIGIRGEHMRWAFATGKANIGRKSLSSIFECGETPSMWWTSLIYERHPKISPWLYPLYKLRTLEIFMEREKVTSLRLAGGDSKLEQTLRRCCKARGIKFTWDNQESSDHSDGLLEKLYYLMPAPLRAIVRYAHWWWTIRRKLPQAKKLPQAAPGRLAASIITYFPNIDIYEAALGHFRSRYWEDLHTALNEEARKENPSGPHFVRWVFIRFPSSQLDFAQCRKISREFGLHERDGLSFNYLEDFLAFADLGASLGRWLRLCAKSLLVQRRFRRQCCFPGSTLNFWPYVKEQWAESFRGWRCLERCLQNRAFRSYYKLAGRQRWTLFPLENCPWERMLTEAARSVADNGPVYGAQHSIIRPTDFRYFDDPLTFVAQPCDAFQPDLFCSNGQSASTQWLNAGMPANRMRQLEALRYQYLGKKGAGESRDSDLPPEPGMPLEMPAEKRMLVLTSFFQDETESHLQLLAQALNDGILKDWQISIKPHPYLPVEKWLESMPGENLKNVEIVDAPLVGLLRKGTLAWTSNSTTASLEAAIKGLPLMVMAPKGDFDLCPIQNVHGLARTATLEDVKKHLSSLPFVDMPQGYLDLEPGLQKWRNLLGL